MSGMDLKFLGASIIVIFFVTAVIILASYLFGEAKRKKSQTPPKDFDHPFRIVCGAPECGAIGWVNRDPAAVPKGWQARIYRTSNGMMSYAIGCTTEHALLAAQIRSHPCTICRASATASCDPAVHEAKASCECGHPMHADVCGVPCGRPLRACSCDKPKRLQTNTVVGLGRLRPEDRP